MTCRCTHVMCRFCDKVLVGGFYVTVHLQVFHWSILGQSRNFAVLRRLWQLSDFGRRILRIPFSPMVSLADLDHYGPGKICRIVIGVARCGAQLSESVVQSLFSVKNISSKSMKM